MTLAARYQNANHKILFYSYLYGVIASLVVMFLSATVSKTNNAVLKYLVLFSIVSASSALLYVVTPFTPYISTIVGPEWLYTEKLAVIVVYMSLSGNLGVLNARKIRRVIKVYWGKISVLSDLGKMKSFMKYLRTAGTH